MGWFGAAVTMAVSVLTLTVIVELIARVRHPQRLFLIQLGRQRTEEDDARAMRLRIVNAVLSAAALVLILINPTGLLAIAAVTLVPFLITGWLMVEMVGAVRSAEQERVPGRYRVLLEDAPGVRDFISVPLEVINVLSLLVPSAIFAWVLTQLPESVPLHWDAAGNVNRYGSASEMWMMAGFIAFDIALLWGIVWGVSKERWALPEKNAERYSELQFERRRLIVRFVEWIMTAVNVSMGLMWVVITMAWFESTEALMMPLLVVSIVGMTVGSLAPIVVYLRPLMKIRDDLREIAGTEVLGTRSDGWKLGGTIYYAPEDPAVVVPKKIGIGQTLNFARPASWLIMGFILGLPLLITAIALIAAA